MTRRAHTLPQQRHYARHIRNDADDRELVAAARHGDRAALDLLLRRHYDRIHAVCRRVIGSARDADDAAQEALIKIVRSLHAFDERARFATWAYRVATNAALDELRRRGRRPLLHAVDDDGEPLHAETLDPRAHAPLDAVADHAALDEALRAIPEEFRIAVVLRDVGDLDYAEISQALGVPVGTVKSRIARGRAMLAARLGNRGPTAERPTSEP